MPLLDISLSQHNGYAILHSFGSCSKLSSNVAVFVAAVVAVHDEKQQAVAVVVDKCGNRVDVSSWVPLNSSSRRR